VRQEAVACRRGVAVAWCLRVGVAYRLEEEVAYRQVEVAAWRRRVGVAYRLEEEVAYRQVVEVAAWRLRGGGAYRLVEVAACRQVVEVAVYRQEVAWHLVVAGYHLEVVLRRAAVVCWDQVAGQTQSLPCWRPSMPTPISTVS